ncbi:hypothetical protein [Shimia sp.]|uniref:hypothetical protein n=1 Tax=Shimia sp. TaxID=1954381 RepID=UPI00329A0DAD
MSSETKNRKRRPYTFGKLYDTLEVYFPDHRSTQGVLDVPGLARDCGLAHETLYRAVRGSEAKGFPEGMLKTPVALELLKFSAEAHPEQSLSWSDLLEFVLPEYETYN